MATVTVWLLVVIGGRGYYSVPDLPSEQACEILYSTLRQEGWAQWAPRSDHLCLKYQRAAR